jgi:hypothetical protein
MKIESPSLNGGTFTAGLGASAKIAKALTIDAGINILSGTRSGVTGSLQAKFQF